MLIPEFEEFTHSHVPILKEMGMGVKSYDGQQLSLAFPLANNVNDKGTGFAGSLNAATTYCAWGLIRLLMLEHGFDLNLAVVSSEAEYRKAVTGNFEAESHLPSAEQVDIFLTKLQQKGKGSLVLESVIKQDDEVAVYYKGTYVAFPK